MSVKYTLFMHSYTVTYSYLLLSTTENYCNTEPIHKQQFLLKHSQKHWDSDLYVTLHSIEKCKVQLLVCLRKIQLGEGLLSCKQVSATGTGQCPMTNFCSLAIAAYANLNIFLGQGVQHRLIDTFHWLSSQAVLFITIVNWCPSGVGPSLPMT